MSKFTPYLNQSLNNPKVISMQINLLNKCPCKCISCKKYEWPNESLNFNKLKEFIEVFNNQKGETIVFSGGEPLLYNNFKELIEFMNTTNIEYSFITTTLGNRENLELMAKNAKRIHVSCDSSDVREYEKIRGINALDNVIENISFIQKYRKNKIPVRISATISKYNYNQIIPLYSLAKRLDCLINYYLVHTWDCLKTSKDELDQIRDSLVKLNFNVATNAELLIKDIDRMLDGKKLNIPKECIIQKIHMMLDSDGSIYPCSVLLRDNGVYDISKKYVYGNINNDNIIDIFERRFNLKYKPSDTDCVECIRYWHINNEFSNYIKNNDDILFL